MIFHQNSFIQSSDIKYDENERISMINERFTGYDIRYYTYENLGAIKYDFTNNKEYFKGSDSVLLLTDNYYDIIEITDSSSIKIDKKISSLKDVKMFHAKFNIENKNINETFTDSGNMSCVPEILFNYYTGKHLRRPLKLTMDDICVALQDPEIPEVNSDARMTAGYTTKDIQRFCELYDIAMLAIDIHDKLFHSFYPDKKDKEKPVLCFIVANSHMYLCTDTDFKKKIESQTRITNKPSKKIKESNSEIEGDETIIQTDDLLPQLIEYVSTNKRMIISKNNKISNGKVVKIITDEKVMLANTDSEKVIEYIQQFNETFKPEKDMVFSNQTDLSFGHTVFKQLYPFHIQSQMNEKVLSKLKVNAGIVQKYATNVDSIDTCTAIDIRKCRTSCLNDNILGAFKRFTCLDSIEPFINIPVSDLKPGFYYVQTKNYLPARGNGWYTDGFLKYLKENDIYFNIKYQLLSSYTYEPTYLQPFYNNIRKI